MELWRHAREKDEHYARRTETVGELLCMDIPGPWLDVWVLVVNKLSWHRMRARASVEPWVGVVPVEAQGEIVSDEALRRLARNIRDAEKT